jgi:hypothetical protein
MPQLPNLPTEIIHQIFMEMNFLDFLPFAKPLQLNFIARQLYNKQPVHICSAICSGNLQLVIWLYQNTTVVLQCFHTPFELAIKHGRLHIVKKKSFY